MEETPENVLQYVLENSSKDGTFLITAKMKIYDYSNTTNYELSWSIQGNTPLAVYADMTESKLIYISLIYSAEIASIELSYWKSLVAMDTIARDLMSKKEEIYLKGLPHKSLCYMLSYILQDAKMPPSRVDLIAIPDTGGSAFENKDKLYLYYEKLGFHIIEKVKDIALMEGTMEEVQKVCKNIFFNNPVIIEDNITITDERSI